MTVEEGDHAVVQKIGRRDRRLAIIELGASNLGVGVDEGLLVDAPDPLQIANIERVLGAAVARMFALKFAMGLLLGLGLFQRDELGLGQYQTFLALLASRALSRLFMVSRSWRCHTQRTPNRTCTFQRIRLSIQAWPMAIATS